MNACSLFSFDLGACVNGAVLGWLFSLPWWALAALGLLALGIVYRLGGWLGVVAAAGVAGYEARALEDARKARDEHENGDGEPERFQPPPRPHQRTAFEAIRDWTNPK